MEIFEYECSNGHWAQSPTALDACPGYLKGRPCHGTLTRCGPGSKPRRKPEQEPKGPLPSPPKKGGQRGRKKA